MNTIPQRCVYIGVDTHKAQHTIAILGPDGHIPIVRKTVNISKESFEDLRKIISTTMEKCKATKAKIGIEAASFYHLNIVAALEPFYDDIVVFNPKLLGKKKRRREVRPKKSDKIDALNVAMALRDGVDGSMPYEHPKLLELQELNRFKSRLKKNRSNMKKRYRRNLHVLFPGYDQIVNLYGDPSTRLLRKFSSAKAVKKANFDKLKAASQKKKKRGMRTKTLQRIIDLANHVPDCPYYHDALVIEQEMLLMEILRLDRWTDRLEKEFMKRWRRLGIRPRFFDIQGLSEENGAALYAETGDPSRFPTVDTFVAFHGLDPRTFRTGKTVRYGRITKMGTRYAREILGNVVDAMHRLNTNQIIREKWKKASSKGRRFNECRVICMRKLVRMMWGIEKNSIK